VYWQVHGGTSSDDIIRKVKQAAELAKSNRQKYPDMLTVLFFDEANTTEEIGLIKEIMCDHTVKGLPLTEAHELKLIAACNPYRK
jgi:E3 ubiquitin-protein ligase RNF213